jgi:ketosteroid isomerase-like protein
MTEGFRGWLSAWQDVRVEAEDYRDLEDERVLVFAALSGRGKTSGLHLDQMPQRAANLFHLRNGKVTRLINYWDRYRALGDLGLTPEAQRDPR